MIHYSANLGEISVLLARNARIYCTIPCTRSLRFLDRSTGRFSPPQGSCPSCMFLFLAPISKSTPFYRYKVPAGPVGGPTPHVDPKGLQKRRFTAPFSSHLLCAEYLSFLVHPAALCDRCLDRIHGAWFRCAYCAKDLCGVCEALDTHDETHLFVVFKAPVSFPRSCLQ